MNLDTWNAVQGIYFKVMRKIKFLLAIFDGKLEKLW